MLSQVDQTRLPSFRVGLQQGMLQGMQQGKQLGEAAVLQRQLTRRFGSLTEATIARLHSASLDELETWADSILDADCLEDVFQGRLGC